MQTGRPNRGALLCASHSLFGVFLRMLACALCTAKNWPGTVAALGFLRFTFATPQHKLCVFGDDPGISEFLKSCAAFVARPFAKTGKECPSNLQKSPIKDKCFLLSFCYRLKHVNNNSNKKGAF